MTRLNIHDLLFRGVFCDPDRAAEVLQWALPAFLSDHVDWTRVRLLPGDFVHERLAEGRIDLHFQASVKRARMPLLAVLEHQSTEQHRMVARTLAYMLGAWDQWMVANPAAGRRRRPPPQHPWRTATSGSAPFPIPFPFPFPN